MAARINVTIQTSVMETAPAIRTSQFSGFATTGTFALADDCTLNGEVSLTGDLDILGVVKGDGSYPVITAASSSACSRMIFSADTMSLKGVM